MLRINKLTDYAIVILTHIVKTSRVSSDVISAHNLANISNIPKPTVGKILKILSKHSVINSIRGINGGYNLIKKPSDISLLEIIQIMEGDVAITSCKLENNEICEVGSMCPTQNIWSKVNNQLQILLKNITLAEITNSSNISNSQHLVNI